MPAVASDAIATLPRYIYQRFLAWVGIRSSNGSLHLLLLEFGISIKICIQSIMVSDYLCSFVTSAYCCSRDWRCVIVLNWNDNIQPLNSKVSCVCPHDRQTFVHEVTVQSHPALMMPWPLRTRLSYSSRQLTSGSHVERYRFVGCVYLQSSASVPFASGAFTSSRCSNEHLKCSRREFMSFATYQLIDLTILGIGMVDSGIISSARWHWPA